MRDHAMTSFAAAFRQSPAPDRRRRAAYPQSVGRDCLQSRPGAPSLAVGDDSETCLINPARIGVSLTISRLKRRGRDSPPT